MNGESLLLGDKREQLTQGGMLLRSQSGSQLTFVSPRHVRNLGDQLLSGRGQVEGMHASITGITPALKIPAALEFIDVGNDPTGQQPQLGAQRLLTAALIGGDGAQNADMRRGQVQCTDLLGEQPGGVVPELRQQKGNAVAATRRRY